MAVTMPLAQADSFTIELNQEFSGAQSPVGVQPWVTATFTDLISGGVELVISALNLVAQEFIREFYFNFDPDLDATILSGGFSQAGGEAYQTVGFNNNAFKADGDGYFDVKLTFTKENGGSRFTGGETATFRFLTPVGVSVADFDFASVNGPTGKTGFYAAAKIQGIGTNANGSGWITGDIIRQPQGEIPEPASILLLGTLLAGVVHLMRIRRTA